MNIRLLEELTSVNAERLKEKVGKTLSLAQILKNQQLSCPKLCKRKRTQTPLVILKWLMEQQLPIQNHLLHIIGDRRLATSPSIERGSQKHREEDSTDQS